MDIWVDLKKLKNTIANSIFRSSAKYFKYYSLFKVFYKRLYRTQLVIKYFITVK